MNDKLIIFGVLGLITIYLPSFAIGLQRCFGCRSRGELGSCKDPFDVNVTLVEKKLEIGVEIVPCASGWCGKIVESGDAAKEEYGVATQRVCLQRGPSDSEDRCAYTKWNYKRVLMCFCRGDLCNSTEKNKINVSLMVVSGAIIFAKSFIYTLF